MSNILNKIDLTLDNTVMVKSSTNNEIMTLSVQTPTNIPPEITFEWVHNLFHPESPIIPQNYNTTSTHFADTSYFVKMQKKERIARENSLYGLTNLEYQKYYWAVLSYFNEDILEIDSKLMRWEFFFSRTDSTFCYDTKIEEIKCQLQEKLPDAPIEQFSTFNPGVATMLGVYLIYKAQDWGVEETKGAICMLYSLQWCYQKKEAHNKLKREEFMKNNPQNKHVEKLLIDLFNKLDIVYDNTKINIDEKVWHRDCLLYTIQVVFNDLKIYNEDDVSPFGKLVAKILGANPDSVVRSINRKITPIRDLFISAPLKNLTEKDIENHFSYNEAKAEVHKKEWLGLYAVIETKINELLNP